MLHAGSYDAMESTIEKDELELQMRMLDEKGRQILRKIEVVQAEDVVDTLHRHQFADRFIRCKVSSLLHQPDFVAFQASTLKPVETMDEREGFGLENARELRKEDRARSFPDAGFGDMAG